MIIVQPNNSNYHIIQLMNCKYWARCVTILLFCCSGIHSCSAHWLTHNGEKRPENQILRVWFATRILWECINPWYCLCIFSSECSRKDSLVRVDWFDIFVVNMEKSENGINCRCRFLVVCGALACTCYVAAGNYRQWQERPLVTSLKVYL